MFLLTVSQICIAAQQYFIIFYISLAPATKRSVERLVYNNKQAEEGLDCKPK